MKKKKKNIKHNEIYYNFGLYKIGCNKGISIYHSKISMLHIARIKMLHISIIFQPVASKNSLGWKSMHWIWPSWLLNSCKSFPAVRSHSCHSSYKFQGLKSSTDFNTSKKWYMPIRMLLGTQRSNRLCEKLRTILTAYEDISTSTASAFHVSTQ